MSQVIAFAATAASASSARILALCSCPQWSALNGAPSIEPRALERELPFPRALNECSSRALNLALSSRSASNRAECAGSLHAPVSLHLACSLLLHASSPCTEHSVACPPPSLVARLTSLHALYRAFHAPRCVPLKERVHVLAQFLFERGRAPIHALRAPPSPTNVLLSCRRGPNHVALSVALSSLTAADGWLPGVPELWLGGRRRPGRRWRSGWRAGRGHPAGAGWLCPGRW